MSHRYLGFDVVEAREHESLLSRSQPVAHIHSTVTGFDYPGAMLNILNQRRAQEEHRLT
jgi:hypothetical protein